MFGCTQEGLATDFHCSVEAVRRRLRIAALSPEGRAAIETGGNPDDYLLREERRIQRMKEAIRLHRESVDGSLSSDLSKKILWFLAARAPGDCCHSTYFKGAFFDEVGYKIRILTENASANMPPETWIKAESMTVSQEFVILDPSGNRPPGRPTISPLDQLVTKLAEYVMRQESCSSITQSALVKVRQALGVLTSYHDELLIWRTKRITRACFTRLLTERLAEKNSLSSTSGALVA